MTGITTHYRLPLGLGYRHQSQVKALRYSYPVLSFIFMPVFFARRATHQEIPRRYPDEFHADAIGPNFSGLHGTIPIHPMKEGIARKFLVSTRKFYFYQLLVAKKICRDSVPTGFFPVAWNGSAVVMPRAHGAGADVATPMKIGVRPAPRRGVGHDRGIASRTGKLPIFFDEIVPVSQ
jgi:hypothetical protein